MKKSVALFLCLVSMVTAFTSQAIDLKESKVTQVVNDVQIISGANQAPKPAAVNDIFSIPDVLHTGAGSRAELIAKDETITRVGANTIFSFDPASRTIDLKQGSLLFHSPHGKGGGTIRTGSATASVLGTTLIVTTTPNGGMKVLDLEGSVEVKKSEKAKQKLSAGQMTFILPGGDQLAPVIVFRLDELVRNSQLVKGFTKPLSSIPLIQDQIDRQRKLIKQGKASDTGLLVGDSATPNQVEVLDPNTIQNNNLPAGGARKALSANATITSSSLTDSLIPTPPSRVFVKKPFTLAGNNYFGNQKFYGFAGLNINFNVASPSIIDMSPYATTPVFSFVAAKKINLNDSVTFSGLTGANQLFLNGGEQITFAPNITLQADVGDFTMATPGDISMDGVKIYNDIGNVTLNSGSTIYLKSCAILPKGEFIVNGQKAVTFYWDHDGIFGQQGQSLGNSINSDAACGEVNITARTGSLSVSATSIQAHYLTLNSGDSILLDCAGRTLTATGPGATANFNAGNTVTVNNANLTAYDTVNMSAPTVLLKNVDFGANSTVGLSSGLHALAENPNTDAAIKAGYVNMVHGVTYGGVLVTAPSGFVNGLIPGTGITIQ